jgi:hypothetical protein
MFVLTALFALRVAGQAVQLWDPQPWLPPFAAWQGSSLAYSILLPTQLAILGTMAWITLRARRSAWVASTRAAWALAIAGCLYMLGALGRIAVGLTISAPPPWFTAWIPAAFHVVLAAFVLACAGYHATGVSRQPS